MYTIGDFLIQVKNAYMAKKKELSYPSSKVVMSIGKILEKEGYVGKIKIQKSTPIKSGSKTKNMDELVIELKYENREPAVSDIKIISKPSVHHYINRIHLKKYAGNYGVAIFSTSKGMMTGKQAQKDGVGGELICQIY